jgi:hypothetical protein
VHIGCCGSGVAASIGESATAMGSERAVRPIPASPRRPGPTGRSGSLPPSRHWLWPGVLTTEGGASEASSKQHLGRCGSGLAAWVGESATAMGSGHPGGSTPTCAMYKAHHKDTSTKPQGRCRPTYSSAHLCTFILHPIPIPIPSPVQRVPLAQCASP